MPKSYLHYYFFVILILLSSFKCFAIENTASILNNDSITSPHKINISNIKYLNLSTTYNGRPKIISAYDVPNGVTLSYSPNSNVEAGTYDITVTIYYKNKIIDVQLLTQVIKKKTYDHQVRLRKPRIAYTGKEIFLEVMGPIPPNTEIVYFNEKHTNVGVYFVHAFMFNKNYKSTVFSNYLEILKIPIDRQKIIFNSLQTPYDGTVKKLELKSTLPSEIQIFQINNAHTEVGTYKVKAYLYGGRNYISTIVERTLQITGKPTSTIPTTPDTSKLEFKAQEFIFVPNDPQPIKKIEITGELPKDVTVEYINNELQYPGSINPLAIIKYKDEIIDIKETTLKIESIKLPEITFPNETFEYKFDSITKKSTPYSLPLIDNLPETVQVDFIKNSQSEVGEYSVGMHASGPGYAAINNSINYEASNLTIKKAKLPPIVFRNKDFFYDGEPKSISIDTVNLPPGAFVTYLGNDQTEIGNHIVKAIINGGNNHLSQIISATMSIKFKEGSAPSLKEVAFEDLVVKYNGTPFSLYATNIPDNITVDYNITNVTDIGVYNIIATFYFENKIIDTKKATLTITKGEIDYVTFDNTSFVYDGTPKILVINGDLPEGTSVSYSRNVITEVSSISITAYINGGINYKNKELRAKLTITKAELPDFKFDSASYVFDGTSKSIVIEGDLPNYISVSYKNNKHTNAGNHTAIANINGGRNYFDKELKATLQITKADISIVNFNDASFVYDGKPKSLKINDILPEGTSVIYSYNNQINVGTYQVSALCYGNNNYNLFEVKAILTITKAELSNLTFNSASFVYDGKPKSLVLNNKLPKGTTVEYLNNKQTAPGTYEVIAKIDGGKNYNSTELKATLTINKAELPNLTFDNASFTYDGTPKSLVINDNLPDGVTINYSNNKHIDAGDYEVIAHINGGDKYNNTELKAMLTINKTKLPIIKLNAASFVYDGTPKALIINDILPEGVTVSYSNNMQINVGEYKVIAHINGGKNYENTELTAMLTIEKAELSLTYDNATFVYDGTHKTLIINDMLPEGIKVTYSNNKHINSGNYEAIAIVNGGINYNNIELKAHLVITKAELSNLTFDNATFVYDRLPKSLTLKGNLLDDIIVTYSNNKQTNTGVYQVTAMINGGRNYNSKELNAILTIIKAELPQVVFNSASYTYDGTQKSLILKGNIPEETTVKYINNRHTDVGVYEASAIINGGKNYYDSELKSLLVITKNKLPKLTFNDASYIYDGTPKSLILKENLPEGTIVTYANNKHTNAGVYEITAIINGGKNYNDTQLKANLTINKAELPKLTFDNAAYTYDGTPKSLILTGNIPEGVTVTYSNNKYTDAGIYEVTALINGGKNYNNSQLKANLTITKAGLPKLTFDNATYAYDGTPKSLILTGNIPEGVTVTYSNNKYTDVGVYEVTATINGGKNYNYSQLKATLTITKADIACLIFNDATFIYDGTPKSAFIQGELPNGIEVKYINNNQTNAGDYEIIASINGGNNFNNLQLKATLSITKAQLSTINFEDSSFVYNSEPKSLFINSILPKGVTVTYTNNSQINAGTYVITAQIDGGKNYINKKLKAMLTITKATLSNVVLSDALFTYDGIPKSLIITGNVPKDATVIYSNNTQTNVGSYIVTAYLIGGNNYIDLKLKGKLIIAKAELPNIILENGTHTYDGTTKSLAIKGYLPEGTTVTYTNNSHANAGSYEVTAQINGGKNYSNKELKATLKINKTELPNIILENSTHTYDGTTKSLAIKGYLPEGTTVTYTNNSHANAGSYEVTAQINGGKNYSNKELKATLTITKGDIACLIFNDVTYTYDGTPKSAVINGNLPDGIRVDYSNNKQTEVGSYEIIATVNGGLNFNSYKLKAKLSIIKATLPTIEFEDATFVYDGTPKSLIIKGKLPNGATVTYTNNAQVNAGNYVITAYIDGGKNYNNAELKAVLTITEKQATVPSIKDVVFEDKTVTYNGNTHSLKVLNLPKDVIVSFDKNEFIEVGKYTITASFYFENKLIGTKQATLTITEKQANVPSIKDVVFEDKTVTYNGNTHSLKVLNLPKDVRVSFDNNEFVEVGTYTITASFYYENKLIGTKKGTLTIVRANEKAELIQVTINGQTFENIKQKTTYFLSCGENEVTISIDKISEFASIDTDRTIEMTLTKMESKLITITVNSESKQTSNKYVFELIKTIDFNQVTTHNMNNIIAVNKDITQNGGYNFIKYEWFKNNELVSEKDHYVVGAQYNSQSDKDAMYYVKLFTDQGQTIYTCLAPIHVKNTNKILLHPNPVKENKKITFTFDSDLDQYYGATLEVYTVNGRLIHLQKLTDRITEVQLPLTIQAGYYIAVIKKASKQVTMHFVVE